MSLVPESVTLDYLGRRDTILSFVLDDLFDGVYIVDTNRTVVFWNKGAERITGFTADEVVGRLCGEEILHHIDEEGRPLCGGACPLMQCITSGEKYTAKVYPCHKNGRRFPVVTNVAPIRNESGELIGAIEIFRDVSSEEEFRKLQDKFNKLMALFFRPTALNDVLNQAREGGELESRERDVTVMFVDIVGFTDLSERHSPADVVALLNQFFAVTEKVIRDHHGEIDKIIGDAVMAVFIDAADAVAAGGELLEALEEFNQHMAAQGREPVRIRIGAHSGVVVEGPIGGSSRKDMTIIGDVVNTAQRVERSCPPSAFCVSEAVYARIAQPDMLRFMESAEVKGKSQPINLYRWEAPSTGDGKRSAP
jgi:PAS domain S-box-containing protein